MSEKKKSNVLKNIWFTARWYTGAVIDIWCTVGAIMGANILLEHLMGKNFLNELGIPMSMLKNTFVYFSVVVSAFTAMMSGRQWARTQYFTHILPEVWDDTMKSFMAAANEEHGDKK